MLQGPLGVLKPHFETSDLCVEFGYRHFAWLHVSLGCHIGTDTEVAYDYGGPVRQLPKRQDLRSLQRCSRPKVSPFLGPSQCIEPDHQSHFRVKILNVPI